MVVVVVHAAMTALTAVHAALTVTGNTDFDLLALFVLLGSKTNQPTHKIKKTEKLNSLGTERDEIVTDFF